MANDVVLGSALRSNLLSLQNTQRSIDVTQLRLATGRKVNSALDNPQNFFAAEALRNRASDLTRLLDGIGQSIRTIEAADRGVTALTGLIEQAQSVVNSARDALAANTGTARAVGNRDLSAAADLTALTGTPIAAGDQFVIDAVGADGLQVSETITIAAGDTVYSLAAKITDAFADNENGEVTASVTREGFLSIEAAGGRSFRIEDTAGGTAVTLAGFAALGLDRYFEDETRGAATLASTTIVAGNTIGSISLFESPGNLADAGDVIAGSTFTDADGNTVLAGFAAGDTFNFTVNNSGTITTGAVAITAATTFQDVIDQINLDTDINEFIEASFDARTGSISITSKLDTVENLQLTYVAAGATTFDIGLGDPSGRLDPLAGVAAGTYDTVFSFNNSTQALDSLANDYNRILSQIDDIVEDANFRGVNLLRSDNLTTFFNEDRSNRLVTEGRNFTAGGLGLNQASFRSADSIESTADETITALNDVRAFGSSLANDLSIIQVRRTFTEETSTTLKAGAADLTDADLNEEGANLLALQTRQQLGVTALSLASQSQQSVLRLF